MYVHEKKKIAKSFAAELGATIGAKKMPSEPYLRNVTDMHETIYPYAIIEHLDPGLFSAPKEREWYDRNEGKGEYCESEVPSCVDWPEPPFYPLSFL